MIGREPLGHDQDAVHLIVVGEGAELVEDVGARPRLGRASSGLPTERPTVGAQPGRLGDRCGRSGELVDVGIALEYPQRQGVSSDQHPRGGWELGEGLGHLVGQKAAIRADSPPGVNPGVADAGLGAGRPSPIVVLPDRSGRVVRCEHQADDVGGADLEQVGHAVLDKGGSVLLAQCGHPASGLIVLQRQRDRRHLVGGPASQRGGAAQRFVTTAQVGERLVGGRASPANVGVVGLDLLGRPRRAVRHDQGTSHPLCVMSHWMYLPFRLRSARPRRWCGPRRGRTRPALRAPPGWSRAVLHARG